LLAHQADSGLWRTVVTRPDSYEETSATAMIAYGLAKGLELGLIDGGCAPAIRKAWKALKEQVDERGAVMGVSAGTGPTNFEGYQGRPTGEFPWGTGAFLMAGSQIRGMGLAE
jgi:unsaturated rhamnogalacturonyl hydrolase